MILTTQQRHEADVYLKRLEHYRSEVSHECSLVGHRMSWLTTCQSFLIAAFVIVHSNQIIALRLVFSLLLPIIGIYVARKIHLSVSEADKVIDYWHGKERVWHDEVCRLPDVALTNYLLTFWSNRVWPAPDELQAKPDTIHNNSFEFQRKFQAKLILTWSILLLLGLGINIYAAYRLGTLDALCGIPKISVTP